MRSMGVYLSVVALKRASSSLITLLFAVWESLQNPSSKLEVHFMTTNKIVLLVVAQMRWVRWYQWFARGIMQSAGKQAKVTTQVCWSIKQNGNSILNMRAHAAVCDILPEKAIGHSSYPLEYSAEWGDGDWHDTHAQLKICFTDYAFANARNQSNFTEISASNRFCLCWQCHDSSFHGQHVPVVCCMHTSKKNKYV